MNKPGFNFRAILLLLIILVVPGWALAAAFHSPDPAPQARQVVQQPAPPDIAVPVLTYHRILSKVASPFDYSPEQLEEQFRYLKAHGYHPITALQMMSDLNHPELFPAKPVVLSFDDGHPSHYRRVFPLLQKYGFPATFFVYPNQIMNHSKYYLTWQELAEMARAGEDIESHTMSHPYLTEKKDFKDRISYLRWLDNELANSRRTIENSLHQKVALLAYPYGWFNSTVEDEAKKAGYQGIFTVNWGNNAPGVNPLRIKRRVMANSMTLQDLERCLSYRALKLRIISPADAAVVTRSPEIKFKLYNPGLKKVMVMIRTSSYTVTPDSQGVYRIPQLTGMKPGFYMIIIKALDAKNNLYMDSWGFDYEKTA